MDTRSSNGPNSEKFISAVIDCIADPVFVKDRQHRWVYLNKAFCEFMGYNKEQLLGKTDYDFFPKPEAKMFWEKDEVVFTTKEENTNEENFTDSKKITHVIMTKKMFLKIENGEEYIVGIIRDVTERRAMETELRNKVRDLEIFNKAAVDRELRMIELKDKISSLESQLKRT